MYIARNVMHDILNIIIVTQNFLAHPIYLSFSAIVRACFKAGIYAQTCLKLR